MSIEYDPPRYNPSNPDTRTLELQYSLTENQYELIAAQRDRVTDIIRNSATGLIAVVGPCALTNTPEAIEEEGMTIAELDSAYKGLAALHRLPPWKPRTRREDWHGLETTEPEAAYRIIADAARSRGNVAIEMGHYDHVMRYELLTTLGWVGGRNVQRHELAEAIAIHDHSLPIAVKNGLNGAILKARQNIQGINKDIGRNNTSPATLIYRGGENAQTPEAWERQYVRVLQQTRGNVIVDVAHGSEMAHDPEGGFQKSVEGQENALEHVIRLAEMGHIPMGVMIEASDIESPTDPVMPLQVALDGVKRLYEIKMGIQNTEQDELLVA
jgi:phospho-2-dehydro-3-deoxyheptonate aldolase